MSIDTAEIPFYPSSPEFIANPYPYYQQLRAIGEVIDLSDRGLWLLTSYRDCFDLLRDQRLGHEVKPGNPMVFQNPPDHTRLRRLLAKAFTPRAIEERLATRVQQLTEELLDEVEGAGEMDLVADFAFPLPVKVICDMFGVPAEDHVKFAGWSDALVRTLDPTHDAETEERFEDARNSYVEYLSEVIAERRAYPRDDLLSALIEAEEEGDKLTEAELYTTSMILVTAGHVTTVNLISTGVWTFLRHPDQLAKLRNDPGLIEAAVEEILRYDSPTHITYRYVLSDVEHNGNTFREGEVVAFLLACANRDPAAFENPEAFDIEREDNRHLAFGTGIHSCLGAPLARLEGRIALETLWRRLPGLSLTGSEPEYSDNYVTRGVRSLTVRF